MKIRKFKSKDGKEVSKIMIAAFKSFLGDKFDRLDLKSFSPQVLKKISNTESYDGEVVSYVAEEKGKILGYIRGSAHMNGLGSSEVVGVDTSSFHKGVGTKLMKKLEKFWKSKKQRKISTCVSAHNKRALIYYLKNGFIPEGYRKDHFKVGVDEIILGRFL
ncbi:MAG: GNAT family N-acetyltransferase [Candidatus Omnitrophica bacterium]|nr:GNAT family N-acetyltransferase [Candidatus Omnitrophota bacterium]